MVPRFRVDSFTPLFCKRNGDCSNGEILSGREDKRKKADSNTFFNDKYDLEIRGKSQIRGFWGRDDREGSEAERKQRKGLSSPGLDWKAR